jgi:betaine lipid synthase
MRGLYDKESKDTGGADLITLRYSLTIIPEFYPVIDSTVSLLSIYGIIAVVDF